MVATVGRVELLGIGVLELTVLIGIEEVGIGMLWEMEGGMVVLDELVFVEDPVEIALPCPSTCRARKKRQMRVRNCILVFCSKIPVYEVMPVEVWSDLEAF